MTTPYGPIEGGTLELVASLGGRLTYRQLDVWLRNGWITLSYTDYRQGRSHERQVTPTEAAAIRELVDVYEQAMTTLAEIRSGEMYATILAGLEAVPC